MTADQLDFILHTLKSKHKYESLPDKAVHKLSYLVYLRAQKQGADLSIPYFWYRYGVLTQPSSRTSDGPAPTIDSDSEELVAKFSERVLEEYYTGSLEKITDTTYREAPYEVFRNWRELDKQISELSENYNPFFDNTPIKDELESKVEKVYDSFPAEEFPNHTSDLATWYFSMTGELDGDLENVQRLHEINTVFWGIFTLSVSRKHHPNMTQKEVREALGISSFDAELAERREKLSRLEQERINDRFDSRNPELDSNTDAMIEPILESL